MVIRTDGRTKIAVVGASRLQTEEAKSEDRIIYTNTFQPDVQADKVNNRVAYRLTGI